MSDTLPNQQDCCLDCADPVVTAIPGPSGPSGGNGSNGTDGIDAFSFVDGSTPVAVPAWGGSATIALKDPQGSRWMGVLQLIFLSPYGYYRVTAIPNDNQATILNLGNGTDYPGNVNNGANFADNTKVSPAGLQGPAGTITADVMLKSDNLSGLTNATARANLGLGTMATQNAISVAITGGTIAGITDLAVADGGTGASTAAAARTNLGAAGSGLATASGLTVSVVDRVLGRQTPGVNQPVEEIVCTSTGRSLIASSDLASLLIAIGRVKTRYGLLGSVTVNLDNGGSAPWDQTIFMTTTRCIIRRVIFENASANLAGTAFRCGLYTGAGATGNAVITTPFSPAALTAATKWIDATLAAYPGTDVIVPPLGVLKFYGAIEHATPGQTMNVWIYGEDLTP